MDKLPRWVRTSFWATPKNPVVPSSRLSRGTWKSQQIREALVPLGNEGREAFSPFVLIHWNLNSVGGAWSLSGIYFWVLWKLNPGKVVVIL